MSKADYEKQAALVVRVLPEIEKEPCFAIKGGTAINLFELNLPRLSVDIDLTFLTIAGREESISEINKALERVSKGLKRHGIDAILSGAANARKIYCSANRVGIKVEPNFILRGTAFPVRKMEVCEKAQDRFGMARMQVLSFQELYGGKVCAALDRQHPRDLFDMAQFYKAHSLEEIKEGFREENAWGIPHFGELPAIRWKRRNLESLRKSNPEKFNAQRESLERLFEEETLP